MERGDRRHFHRGNMLFELKRWRDAIKEFRLHLAAEPNDAHALATCAAAYLNLSPPEAHRARAICDDALRADPTSSYALYVRAVCAQHVFTHRPDSTYTAQDLHLETRRLVLESLRFDASFVPAWLLLADAEQSLKNREAMRNAIAEALRRDPQNVAALMMCAEDERSVGNASAALKISFSALSSAPDSASAHLGHGQQLMATRDRVRARRHFREALRIDPTLKPAADAFHSSSLSVLDRHTFGAWMRWFWRKLRTPNARGGLSPTAGLVLFPTVAILAIVLGPKFEQLPARVKDGIAIGGLFLVIALAIWASWRRIKEAWRYRERRPKRRR